MNIAVMASAKAEIQPVIKKLSHRKEKLIDNVLFATGNFYNCTVTTANYNSGKVNAALVTAIMLRNIKPDYVLAVGLAGRLSNDLESGDIVIADYTTYHDYGIYEDRGFRPFHTINPFTRRKNPEMFPADRVLLSSALQARKNFERKQDHPHEHKIVKGTILSGDSFIASFDKNSELKMNYPEAAAVDMDCAAIAQVCWQLGVPFLAIKAVSDYAGSRAKSEFAKNLKPISDSLAAFIFEIIGRHRLITPPKSKKK